MGTYEMTSQQFALLYAAYFYNGNDLTSYARHVGIDKTSSGRIVRLLEDKNYIRTSYNPEDRRQKYLSITNLGVDVIESAEPLLDHITQALFDCFDEEEQEQFLNLLEKFVTEQNAKSRAPVMLNRGGGPLGHEGVKQVKAVLKASGSNVSENDLREKLGVTQSALQIWGQQFETPDGDPQSVVDRLLQENKDLKVVVADLYLENEKLRSRAS